MDTTSLPPSAESWLWLLVGSILTLVISNIWDGGETSDLKVLQMTVIGAFHLRFGQDFIAEQTESYRFGGDVRCTGGRITLINKDNSVPVITDKNDAVLLIRNRAWGNRWPRRTGCIRRIRRANEGVEDDNASQTFCHQASSRTDESFVMTEASYDDPFSSPARASSPDLAGIDVGEPLPYDGRTDEWDYSCAVETGVLKGLVGGIPSAIIERDEYRYLLYALRKMGAEITPAADNHKATERSFGPGDLKAFLLIGQPGTGKTFFLIWLLLHLLEHRQPVAWQSQPDAYYIFRPDGVFECSASGPGSHLLKGVWWALVDSNASIKQPAHALTLHAKVVVYACPPEPDRWKEWATQNFTARIIVTEVPHIFEAAAAGHECNLAGGLDTSVELYRLFGPSLRTIATIQAEPQEHQPSEVQRQEQRIRAAAKALLKDPDLVDDMMIFDVPSSVGPHLAFIRPERGLRDWRSFGTDKLWSSWVTVPTHHLRQKLHEVKQADQGAKLVELFSRLSGHAVTRSAKGFAFELKMHRRFSQGGPPVDLIGTKGQIRSTCKVPDVTVAALEHLSSTEPSYWLPHALSFPGLDGVLTNGTRLFALQATVDPTPPSPEDGLRKLWTVLGPARAESFRWHFVIVVDKPGLAGKLLAKSRAQLRRVRLGEARIPVTVAAAVLG